MKIQKRLGAVLLTAALLGSQLGTAAYPVYALESKPESMASAENLPSEAELPMEQEPVSSEEILPQEELSSETAEFNEPPSETQPEEQTSVKVENSWRFQNGEPIPAVSDGVNRNSTSTNRWPEVSRATAKGVDVSRWHGEIDWDKVYRDSEVQFAVLRCGSGYTYENNTGDERWRDNADACTELGIPFGAYFYSYAMNVEEARKEADIVLELLQGYKLDLPVYYDLEDEKYTGTLSNQEISDIAQAFCERIEAAGYTAGIYANKTWFTTKLTDTRFDQWERWVAQWNDECTYEGDYSMWQWCSDGVIPGIDSKVDLNYWFGKELPNSEPTQSPQMKIRLNAEQTKFTVELANVKEASSVSFPVWSDKNGQDDLLWHPAKKVNDVWKATIDIKNHNSDVGLYHVHAYKVVHNKMSGILASTVAVEGVTYDSASIVNTGENKFRVTANVTSPATIKHVKVAVWSDNGGQDDLIWYNAKKSGSSWVLDVDTGKHNYDGGLYHAHVYSTDARGVTTGKALSTTVTQPAPKMAVTIDKDQQTMSIQLANVRASGVSFPVWSDRNGQDDLVWYSAKKNGDGVWTATVNIKNHKNDTGLYHIHAYKVVNGKMSGVLSQTASIEGVTYGQTEITTTNDGFRVTVKGVSSPAGIKLVQVPVWSAKNGQDDLIWYTAKKSGNDWVVDVKIKDHKKNTGLYHVHVYVTDKRGVSIGVANTTTV